MKTLSVLPTSTYCICTGTHTTARPQSIIVTNKLNWISYGHNRLTLIFFAPLILFVHLFPFGSSSFFFLDTLCTKNTIATATNSAARAIPPIAAPTLIPLFVFFEGPQQMGKGSLQNPGLFTQLSTEMVEFINSGTCPINLLFATINVLIRPS